MRRQSGALSTKLAVIVGLAALALLFTRITSVVTVHSSDMYPELLPGDRVLVYTGAFSDREPERGRVVAYEVGVDGDRAFPADLRSDLPRATRLGRLLGLPGDSVESGYRLMRLNGDRVYEERLATLSQLPDGRSVRHYRQEYEHRHWVIARDEERREPELPPTLLKPGRYLVLGDLRSDAYDSRFWGSFARSALVGRPILVLASWHPRDGVRWLRTGHFVDP